MNQAIAEGKTGYCAAAGIMPLREALAHDVGSRRGLSYSAANVVVQPGGKPVIGKFIQTVMNPGEGVLYPNPGYPIYESMIEYYGGQSLAYRYVQTDTGFAIDLDHLRSQITSANGHVDRHHLQQPAEPARLREHAGGDAGHRRHRDRARPHRAGRRGVLRDALLGREHVDRLAAGHVRAHGHPLHVLEEVRDDGLAPRCRHRAASPSRRASPSSTPTTRAAPPTSCRRPAWRASPARRTARWQSSPSCSVGATPRGASSPRSTGWSARSRSRRSTCSPRSPI